ncbi:MAG: flagellar hook-associated protein FlgL [Eubacterium sp.]|nr:flagellar hook-associated protein FlgL [Eubacterium sp.]
MRVTNNMMRNNSMMNMQKNKVTYNKHLQEYNTQKKIQRPSDDPTIAVRALKYRTTLSEIDQYLSNIDDAISWMDATETVMKDVDGRLDEMITICTQAATGTVNAEDRENLVLQLRESAAYIFEQDANQDYAGRYLFTGYRTDVPLLFENTQTNVTYNITEEIDINHINKYEYVYGEPSFDDSKSAQDYASEASRFNTTHRALVSYDNCDDDQTMSVTYTDADGNEVTVEAITKKIEDDANLNEHLNPGDDEIFFVPETGEIVFGDGIYDSIRAGSGLSVNYQKTEFENGEIRPEHYFDCVAKDNTTGKEIKYSNADEQTIKYQINFGQTLTVNTQACNAFDTSIYRHVDEISNVCNDLNIMERNLEAVQKRISDCDQGDTETLANLKELEEQISTEIQLQNSVLQKSLSSAITTMQNQKNTLNVAMANHGSRYNRMLMTQSKLEEQRIDTDDAKSQNEDADLGEAYIGFTEANLLYQATLNATSKILGQSLLDFI